MQAEKTLTFSTFNRRADGKVRANVTPAEFLAMRDALMKEWGTFERETEDALVQARICVFENYITGGPGYAGHVYVAVFDGDPSYVWTFTESHTEDFALVPHVNEEAALARSPEVREDEDELQLFRKEFEQVRHFTHVARYYVETGELDLVKGAIEEIIKIVGPAKQ